MDLSGYHLDAVHTDGEFVLLRGSAAKGTGPSLLVLMSRLEHPRPESVRMLEHGHSLRAELDPAWAVRPVELTQHEGRTTLVLEDPGGEPLDQFVGTPMETGQFLRIAIGLSAAVRQLHGRGLIHKDLKPANVMIEASTGQVWLMGFGIASRLPRERQAAEPPEFIAGTLAYMAPEQTGRMNRSIDSRSDLYSLGVTLYEMLTGSLPFTASDPMGWVHCHTAREPVPPGERVPNIPGPVSAIIMKLLAKTAEERYQTAAGLERDLRHCVDDWEAQHRIDQFRLGERDSPDRLVIPERLYGREREIEVLLAAFDRIVAGGRPELVLVSGYSGIGKSSVVNELHKPLVPPRGLFASGKFDQYKRDIPYASLAQAFQSLLRPLLSKSEAELSKWRDALREALDPNGQLIVDLVPELKFIIGEQPPLPEVSPQDAQARFQLVFGRFISVFARPEHPLALFLDDLQWLDVATLDLIEGLLTRSDIRYLVLIGAYRDNEVDRTHPLMRKLEAIREAGATVQTIVLAPLALEDLRQLVADSLHCDPERAEPLGTLIHEKTTGNPFFAIQFFSALADESLLTFDYDQAHWSWDLNRIETKGYTDNVVDLMVGKLNRLPIETQKALQQLACLGNSADFAMLRILHQDSNEEMHEPLWEAVRTGLIFRSGDSYRFLHDRVQEAAYSLIPEESRGHVHLRIGRLLAAHIHPEKREERIFDIVNQLNRGSHLITSAEEREGVAELNSIAGRRAKNSTAYASALSYLSAGRALLTEGTWDSNHELIFSIEYDIAECEFLTGELKAAERRLAVLSTRAANTVDRAAVACLRVDLYTTMDQSDLAIAVCLDYLHHLGVDWSPNPTEEEVRREYEQIWSRIGSRSIEDLLDLPLMNDPASLATLDVLAKAIPPAYYCDENLLSLVLCRMVNMSLEHGNGDGSCVAYVFLTMTTGPRFGNYEAGSRFGRLGYDLVEKRGLKRHRARTYMCYGNIVIPWTKHVRSGRDLVRRAFDAANQIGDLTFAAYSCSQLITNLLAAGDPLAEVQREAENGLAFAQKARFGLMIDEITAQLGLIRSLRGLTRKFGSFDDEGLDELQFERLLSSGTVAAEAECWYSIRKLQARFTASDFASALKASMRAEELLWTSPAQFVTAEFRFYSALTHAASWDSALPDTKQHHFDALTTHFHCLETWAENCPENFENRAALVGAEIARIEGRLLDAQDLYEEAIRSAHANGFVHNEALANEFAGRFYATRGFEQIANLYLRNARDCYLVWGADGKVRQLEDLYPHLRLEEQAPPQTSTIRAPVEYLDLATFLKVSQAVSGEIVLEKLIDTLLRTAIEHAGAQRGLLILPQGAELRIQAEAIAGGSSVKIGLINRPITGAEVPEPVIQYAARTQESVILDDALARGSFSSDEYVRRQHARSILCLPLVKQGVLVAILYLENNLAPNVFTPARIAVLNVLASGAAISLENSRLYRELQEREAKIRRLVDANIVGIFIWDLEGRILEANDAFLRMVGYDREDLVEGRVRWTDLTPPEWLERDERRWMPELKMKGSLRPFEKEYVRKDGRRVPVLIGVASFEEGGEQGVAFVLDLTERKRAEQERERLRQLEADIAHINRVSMMGELAASLAHEIKQPIGAAVTNAEACMRLLDRDRPDIPEARESALEMVKDGRRAATIIDRVRALYQKGPPKLEIVDVNECIREIVVLLKDTANQHSILIRTELDTGLPTITADRVQMQQVLMNLMLNGIEAMKDTGGELTVTSKKTEDGQLVISVTDAGIGLPVEQTERIFETFFTTKPGGTGMGLSISRAIIESHGGRLWASANAGRGATFQFTLPRVATASSPSAA